MLNDPADLFQDESHNLSFTLVQEMRLDSCDVVHRWYLEQTDMVEENTPQVATINRIYSAQILDEKVQRLLIKENATVTFTVSINHRNHLLI